MPLNRNSSEFGDLISEREGISAEVRGDLLKTREFAPVEPPTFAGEFTYNWSSDPAYKELADILRAAYDQAATGKGKERHANDLPFKDQRMQTISSLLNSDAGMAFQAMKKLTEGLQFTDPEKRERELLGAINYIAGIILWHRQQS